MKVFLDENFPLALVRELKADGLATDHVITIGWRGASDEQIREHLSDPDLLFLRQDEDFLFSKDIAALVLLSRVRQARPLRQRIDIWPHVVRDLIERPPSERRLELLDDGTVIPWEEGPENSWITRPPRAKRPS